MKPVRWLLVLNLLMIALVFLLVNHSYDLLPERIPVHFGISGVPDGWGHKSSLWTICWILVGLNALMMSLLGLIPWFRRHPEWVSGGKQLEKLTPEQADCYWSMVGWIFMFICLPINLMFASIMRDNIRVALDLQSKISIWPMWLLIPVTIAIIIYLGIKMNRMVKNAINSLRASETPPWVPLTK